MKTFLSVVLLGLWAVCGCAHHYTITLNDGTQVGTTSKPKMQGGAYVFKDAMGNERRLPAGRVSEIAPSSMTRDNSAYRYNSSSK